MEYTDKEKHKLLNRISRMRGQLAAMLAGVQDDTHSCTELLQQATACRGALDGFIATVIEHHIRQHLIAPDHDGHGGGHDGASHPAQDRAKAAEELISVVHAYLT